MKPLLFIILMALGFGCNGQNKAIPPLIKDSLWNKFDYSIHVHNDTSEGYPVVVGWKPIDIDSTRYYMTRIDTVNSVIVYTYGKLFDWGTENIHIVPENILAKLRKRCDSLTKISKNPCFVDMQNGWSDLVGHAMVQFFRSTTLLPGTSISDTLEIKKFIFFDQLFKSN